VSLFYSVNNHTRFALSLSQGGTYLSRMVLRCDYRLITIYFDYTTRCDYVASRRGRRSVAWRLWPEMRRATTSASRETLNDLLGHYRADVLAQLQLHAAMSSSRRVSSDTVDSHTFRSATDRVWFRPSSASGSLVRLRGALLMTPPLLPVYLSQYICNGQLSIGRFG